jgi:hypothetical protein
VTTLPAPVRGLVTLLGAVLLAGVGAVSAAAGVLLHGRWWGVPLLLAVLVAVLLALPAGWWSRMAFALGWVAVLGWSLVPRAEGDFLVASTMQGYLLLASGAAVLAWAIVTLPRPGRRARAAVDPGDVGRAS